MPYETPTFIPSQTGYPPFGNFSTRPPSSSAPYTWENFPQVTSETTSPYPQPTNTQAFWATQLGNSTMPNAFQGTEVQYPVPQPNQDAERGLKGVTNPDPVGQEAQGIEAGIQDQGAPWLQQDNTEAMNSWNQFPPVDQTAEATGALALEGLAEDMT